MPEPVPTPLFGISASRLFRHRAIWKKGIRAHALERAKNRCEICGSSESPLICHDQWQYDDRRSTATLVDFEIHCRPCDNVTHPGLFVNVIATKISQEEAWALVIKRMCLINKCSERQAHKIINDVAKLCSIRNLMDWKVEVAQNLLHTYPQLAALETMEEVLPVGPLGLRRWVKHPRFGHGQIIGDGGSYWVIQFVTDGEKKITKTFQLTKGRPPHPWESNPYWVI